jgi:hypothetical protein
VTVYRIKADECRYQTHRQRAWSPNTSSSRGLEENGSGRHCRGRKARRRKLTLFWPRCPKCPAPFSGSGPKEWKGSRPSGCLEWRKAGDAADLHLAVRVAKLMVGAREVRGSKRRGDGGSAPSMATTQCV